MDITETPAQQDARRRFDQWLDDFLPADYYDAYARYRTDMGLRRDHQRAAFEAGWLMPQWDPELGGQRLGPLEALSVRLQGARRRAPKLPNIQGPHVVAPALRQFGTPRQRQHLVPVLRGDEWWALGMSEPDAGSDFSSLQTRAVLEGDTFRVDGQKIWTTQAHESRWCTLYCRTDPEADRHGGISCLILDLSSPGVTIRPIPMAWNAPDVFCELFLDDVAVPVTNLLGPLHDGWRVAMDSLGHERDMIWIMNLVDIERGLDRIREALAPDRSPQFLGHLGQRLADAVGIRYTGYRAATKALLGQACPEALVMKLFGSEALQSTWELAHEAVGPAAADDPELLFESFDALGATIYGGASEIQRNIVGERVLGLPRG